MNLCCLGRVQHSPIQGWHPSGMQFVFRIVTGGVAALNHRLIADIPSGCNARHPSSPRSSRVSRRSVAKTEPEGVQSTSTERAYNDISAHDSQYVRFPCSALAPGRDRATEGPLTTPFFARCAETTRATPWTSISSPPDVRRDASPFRAQPLSGWGLDRFHSKRYPRNK
jgi:hypothetical protein